MTDLKKLADEYCAPYTADHWSLKDVRRNAYLAGARAALEIITKERCSRCSDGYPLAVVDGMPGHLHPTQRHELTCAAESIRSLLPEVST